MSLINIFSNVCGPFIEIPTNKNVSDLKEALNVKIGFHRHWLIHVYNARENSISLSFDVNSSSLFDKVAWTSGNQVERQK